MCVHPHPLFAEPGVFAQTCNCTLEGTSAEEVQLCINEGGLICFDRAIIKTSSGEGHHLCSYKDKNIDLIFQQTFAIEF